MDLSTFSVNYDIAGQALFILVVLSFFIERALSILFEWKPYVKRFKGKGFKEPISLLLSLGVCLIWGFDIIAIMFSMPAPSFLGQVITAAVIAGGSKASIQLFHNILNVKSSAQRQVENGGFKD